MNIVNILLIVAILAIAAFLIIRNLKKKQDEKVEDFINCYNPGNIHDRHETWSKDNPTGRWRKFTYEEIEERNFNLDIKWIYSDDDVDSMTLNEMFDVIKEESTNISNIISEIEKVLSEVSIPPTLL